MVGWDGTLVGRSYMVCNCGMGMVRFAALRAGKGMGLYIANLILVNLMSASLSPRLIHPMCVLELEMALGVCLVTLGLLAGDGGMGGMDGVSLDNSE